MLNFILGLIIGGVIVKLLDSRLRGNDRREGGNGKMAKESLIQRQGREKRQNKEAILGLLETQSRLTNNHIEQLLGISDATATRYLEELEQEGRVRQVGKTGKAVYYEKAK